ncbi:MAG: hypothetical protein IH998_12680 [Proteobacteria bacterium]|nr:hypothetical protein [Pseudomonadota bacterium]
MRLLVNGRYHTFEMHRFCGPMRLRHDLEPAKNQWDEHSPFWPVFQRWMDAGQKIDEFGRGVLT